MAGGVLITAPWATVAPPNITPAEKTGVAGYTEEEFFRLMRDGIKRNGARLLFNYMPWYVYKNMTDADIKAVYAYMMSVPPIENDVNDPNNQFHVRELRTVNRAGLKPRVPSPWGEGTGRLMLLHNLHFRHPWRSRFQANQD